MANRLKMATVEAILVLAARGWSQRRIARELGVKRRIDLALQRDTLPSAVYLP